MLPCILGIIIQEIFIGCRVCSILRAGVATPAAPGAQQGFTPFFMRLFAGFGVESDCMFMIRKPLKKARQSAGRDA